MYILIDFPWKQLRYGSWEQVMNCLILWFGKIWNGSINNFNSLPFLTAQLTAPASLLAVEEWALSNTKLNLFLRWHQCILGECWRQVEDSMLPERPRLFASASATVPSKRSESLGEAGHVYSPLSVSCWGSFCGSFICWGNYSRVWSCGPFKFVLGDSQADNLWYWCWQRNNSAWFYFWYHLITSL